MTINIQAVEQKPLDVNLVGKPYKVKKPKASLALKIGRLAQSDAQNIDGMMGAIEDWLIAATSKRQATAIMARLEDPDDRLDFDHIMELIKAVSEEGSGHPTT